MSPVAGLKRGLKYHIYAVELWSSIFTKKMIEQVALICA